MRISIFLLQLVLWLPLSSLADTRGVSVVVSDSEGQAIELYQGSYALLIGVSRYEDPQWPTLESIPRELEQVAKVLEDQDFVVEKHFDPGSRELENHFRDFIDRYGYTEENRLIFFFAGHGYTRKDGNKGYLVPVDAPSPLQDERGFLRKALPMSQILAWARQSEAKHSLFLFDSCFSGTIFKTRALPDHPPGINKLVSLPVRQFITAGSSGESVPAKSTFTPVFVDALKHGKGDLNQDGYVSGTELGLYLQQEVPKHVQQTPQFGKIQEYELSRGDFIFVMDASVRSSQQIVSVPKKDQKSSASDSVTIVKTTVDNKALELEFWQSIKGSEDPNLYRAYLDQFPGGIYATIAKIKINTAKQRQKEILKKQQAEADRSQKEVAEKEQKLAAVQKAKSSTSVSSASNPQAALITGLWVDDRNCHISIGVSDNGQITGAAWGSAGGSMAIIVEPHPGSDRRFSWAGSTKTMFDPFLMDPMKSGTFTVNLYDKSKLHTTKHICSSSHRDGIVDFFKRDTSSNYLVKPPDWYAMLAN